METQGGSGLTVDDAGRHARRPRSRRRRSARPSTGCRPTSSRQAIPRRGAPPDTISRPTNAYPGQPRGDLEIWRRARQARRLQDRGPPEVVTLFGSPMIRAWRSCARSAAGGDHRPPAPGAAHDLRQLYLPRRVSLPAPIDPKAEAQKLVGRDFRGNEAELIAEGKRRESAAEAWADGSVTNGNAQRRGRRSYLKSMSGTATGIMYARKLRPHDERRAGIQTGGWRAARPHRRPGRRPHARPAPQHPKPRVRSEFAAETQRL